jgi:hypothetical protein
VLPLLHYRRPLGQLEISSAGCSGLLNPELKLANFKAECSNLGIAGQIDGVEALNNILLIGMTNRKDLLDEALLR